jgi:hypothetical protein
MAFNGTEGALIPIEEAAEMTANYRSENPNSTIAHFFGREILEQLLEQDSCEGIRIYYGISNEGQSELVLVGADAQEDDILDLIADRSMPCPKACSTPNPLNS